MTNAPADITGDPQLTLLACQIDIPPTPTASARDAHVSRTASCVDEQLQDRPADLVVLPELSSIDYSRQAFGNLQEIAEEVDGPSFSVWRGVAQRHSTTVVYGIARKADGDLRISQVVVGPDGRLTGCYDKMHVAQYGASMEKEYFQRAGRLFVFEINGIRIAPIICYDIRIPELTRTLCVKHGVQLVLHCGAYARDRSFESWHQFVVTRALENQSFVMSLNRAGADFGSSLFCPPWIDAVTPASPFGDGEEFRYFTVDTALASEARETYPFLADRLDDYDVLPLDGPADTQEA